MPWRPNSSTWTITACLRHSTTVTCRMAWRKTDRKFKRLFRPSAPATRLRRRPLLARGDSGVPRTPRLARKTSRGKARSGQAVQEGCGWQRSGGLVRGPRVGRFEEAGGGRLQTALHCAKGRNTPLRRARRLWTHAGVGVVERDDLLATTGRGNGSGEPVRGAKGSAQAVEPECDVRGAARSGYRRPSLKSVFEIPIFQLPYTAFVWTKESRIA